MIIGSLIPPRKYWLYGQDVIAQDGPRYLTKADVRVLRDLGVSPDQPDNEQAS